VREVRGGERLVITRRLVVNLVVFFVVSFGLVAYGIVNLLGNPLESSTTLTTQFANASGLYPGFEVELNGVPVGTVSSTALTKSGTRVVMSINPGTSVPSDVRSSVQIANDLGEQVVNLVPTRGGPAPALASGATVPAARDDVPADVGQVVATATRLLQAIPAGNLNKLIGEMATALQGNAGNLRTLISAGTTFSKEFVAYQQQFTELLANAPPALDAVTAVAPQLRQDLANTAALVQVLAQNKSGLHNLLTQGSSAFGAVDQLVTNQSANLGCLLHDSAGILSNLAQPTNLTNLSQGLTFNQYFFGAVDNIAVPGLAKPTTSSSPQDPNQIFLRTRLTIPPVLNEPGSSYAQTQTIPDVYPGAGCVTVFGSGVSAASQPGFTPAAGGQVVAPTAQEADVELPSAATAPSTSTAYRVPNHSIALLLVLGLVVVPALALAWGARPARRRTRRRA
jgi:virulence factor Mce-like protein